VREVGIGQGPMARGKPCVPTPRVESPDLDRPCCRVCMYMRTYIHTSWGFTCAMRCMLVCLWVGAGVWRMDKVHAVASYLSDMHRNPLTVWH
jgi:hypothetical protein